MDPILTPTMISAALTKFLDSAASQAGSKAWDALKALVTRHRGRTPELPASAEEASALADELATAAQADPALARELGEWHQSVMGSGNVTIAGSDNVTNNVSGSAERVVQGRDYTHANITLN
ncbi:hypothetical protein [Catenulispora rubra]|uniref:hypothetical protein n=1 Tax=Catenulispora rubra TaxID=280293 RepID=UPI0018924C1F|nr:hypothetical protein [Catenulispora rubra]